MYVSSDLQTSETTTPHGPRMLVRLDGQTIEYDEDGGVADPVAALDRREVEQLREACDQFLAS